MTDQTTDCKRLTTSEKKKRNKLKNLQKKKEKQNKNKIISLEKITIIVNNLIKQRLPITFTLEQDNILIELFGFYLFGSSDSQDADIAVQLKIKNFDCNTFPDKYKHELSLILKTYIIKSGIESEKDIDLCFFELDYKNRCIKSCSKGTKKNLHFYLYYTGNSNIKILLDEPSLENMNMIEQIIIIF